MAKVYYHTPSQTGCGITIWSAEKSLKAAGQELARINAVWPEKSSEGRIITVGKRTRGEPVSSPFHIVPTKTYRLQGNKLVLEGELVNFLNPFGGLGNE